MATDPHPHLPVLVVGAGPTGLTVAAQLAARGVALRIIDRNPQRVAESRALVLQPRSLETFSRMGIVERFAGRGQGVCVLRVWVEGRPVGGLELDDLGYDDTPFPHPLFVSQAVTEEILEDHLRGLGVEVERSTELLALRQTYDHVVAQLRGPDGEETATARWLIGCDGAHSQVRRSLGLAFEGAPYPQEFVLADVTVGWDQPDDHLQIFASRRGLLAVFPLAPGGKMRVLASRAGSSGVGRAPTLDEMQGLVEELSPRPMRLSDPVWLAEFRLHHRGVDRYRKGRVFVAGDAAHIHSPAGGQGMNTGIQDAENLAWKLALVSRGEGRAEALLDSYHDERWPVGRDLLRYTDRLFTLMATGNPLLLWLRSALLPVVVPALTRNRRSRARLFRFVSQLGIRYPSSRIVGEAAASAASPRLRSVPAAGARAPDAPLFSLGGDETSLFTELDGSRLTLLVFSGLPPRTVALEALNATARRALAGNETRVDVRFLIAHRLRDRDGLAPLVDAGGVAHERYGIRGGGMVVLRPDGHIGYRAAGLDAEAVAGHLRGLLAPHALQSSLR